MSSNSNTHGPGKHEKGEFNILPVDEDKKYAPPPKSRHAEGQGADMRSEHYQGPALMPGVFVSSMGANATAFEREHADKSKKE
ncbi:hypothetical protein EDD11_007267 [Mortierella claussenii]|nr:hypothetical protein EDD11_007267 [Mortierella claussenii]